MRITLVKTDGQKRQKVSEKTFISRDDQSWLADRNSIPQDTVKKPRIPK